MPVAEVAHWARLIPLALLVGLAVRYQRRDRSAWLLAGAFAVSVFADTVAHVELLGRSMSDLYPVVQAPMVGMALLDRDELGAYAGLMVLSAVLAFVMQPPGTDLLLYTVAALSACLLVWRSVLPPLLRAAPYTFFGGSWLALVNSFWNPYPWAGAIFHGTTLVGCGLFVLAAARVPQRHLQLVKRVA